MILKFQILVINPGCRHGGGFSLDASIQIEDNDRVGLERLLRYCARPILSMERFTWVAECHNGLIYRQPKPMPDGCSQLYLTPLELLDRLVNALIDLTFLQPCYSRKHCGLFLTSF